MKLCLFLALRLCAPPFSSALFTLQRHCNVGTKPRREGKVPDVPFNLKRREKCYKRHPLPRKKGRRKKKTMYWSRFMNLKKLSYHPRRFHRPTGKVFGLPDGKSSPACYPSAAVQYFYKGNLATILTYSQEKKKKRCVQPGPGESTQKAAKAKRSCCSLQGWLAAAGWNQFDSNSVHPGNTLWQSGLFVSYFTYFVWIKSVDLLSILHFTPIPTTSCPDLLWTHAKL